MRKLEKVYFAVCDGSLLVQNEVRQLLGVYGEEKKVNCVINQITSTAELFSLQEPFDVLLLEMDMPETDGIEAALRLRESGADCKIIVLSGRTDRFKDAFKIGAIRFVTKPIEKEEFFEALDAARVCVEGRGRVQVFLRGRPYHIMQKEIGYIMANGSETRIFTEHHEYRSGIALSGWSEQLGGQLFFLCHRSYLVNLSQVKKIEKSSAVLRTGERVPIARRKQKEFMQALIEREMGKSKNKPFKG